MSFWATNGIRISCTLWGRVLSGPVNSGPLTRSSFVPVGIAQPYAAVFSTGIDPGHPIEGTKRLGNSVVEKLKKKKEPNLGLGVPLTTSHLNKKRQEKLRENNGFMEIAAYGVAQLVDLDSLRKEFKKDAAYRSVPLPADLNLEVLLISADPNSQSDVVPRDAFIFRHLLNVSTSMIETPDFYWDRPDIERLHDQLRSVLSISSRTRVLNSRLNMCCELTQILSNHLQSRHSAHLEWMIIILILVEVCFEASHYLHNRRRELEAHNVLAESHPSEQLHA
ncbi:Glutathione synthetase [Fasciola gigantica]|uniref:Glutathione synthetase n=1 Tax=Fasciola gigantica TaxID=46835 RepID=A0A504YHC5_FASGI|nr:Glutathione synthetase [Fasciola gigantica]